MIDAMLHAARGNDSRAQGCQQTFVARPFNANKCSGSLGKR